jgi:subtilisin family serine protease
MLHKPLKLVLLTIIALVVIVAPFHLLKSRTEAAGKNAANTSLRDKRYIVKSKNSRKSAEIGQRFRKTKVSTAEKNIQKVTINTQAELDALRKDPDIEYVEKDVARRVLAAPDDPHYNNQGNVIIGQYDQWDLRKINLLPVDQASSGWQVTTGSTNTIVAVIDTGLDITHPDIASNVWVNIDEVAGNSLDDDGNGYIDDRNGVNFAYEDRNGNGNLNDYPGLDENGDGDFLDCIDTNSDGDCLDNPDIRDIIPDLNMADLRDWDGNGHGTHVAGTIAAATNNTTGIAGICWTCKVMPLRVIETTGIGYDSDISLAIHYAVDNGAKIINMSLGGPGYTQTLQDAIHYAWSQDVLVVSAAGNNIQGSDSYPGAAQHSISVGAIDYLDSRASFSYNDPRPDITAPGVATLSLNPVMRSTGCGSISGPYSCLSGTSMSAPHVAGVAALLYDQHRSDPTPWNVKDIRWALLKNTTDIFAAGFDNDSGFGRLNARSALLSSSPVASDVTDPVAVLNAPGATVIKGNLSIQGTATDTNLYMYTINVRFASDNVHVVSQKFGRSAVTNGTLATINTSSLADDQYTISLVVEDFAGRTTISNPITVTVDNSSPSSFSVQSPSSNQWVNTPKPTLTWNAPVDVSLLTYDVVVDGVTVGTDITTTSFTVPSNLTDGAHTWYVQADDSVNPVTTSTAGTFQIDTVAPNNFTVSTSVNGSTPTFSFGTSDNTNGSGVSSYFVSVNGSAQQQTSSPSIWSELADGNYSVSVQARDFAGNTTTATGNFTVFYRTPYLRSKADFSADGKVDLSDLSILAQNWQKNTSSGDANNDGKVDLSDLSVLAQNWQKSY